MGFGAWATQPASIGGTVNGSNGATASMTNHVLEFMLADSAEAANILASNLKYAQDGGVTAYDNSLTFSHMDLTKHANFRSGALWQALKIAYASEGASANSGKYGTLTITVARARVTQSGVGDANGRLVQSGSMQIYSVDGSTAPVTYAVS